MAKSAPYYVAKKVRVGKPDEDINALVPMSPPPVGTDTPQSFDLTVVDVKKSIVQAEVVVRYMAMKCTGEKFIANIQGKPYPTVNWWTAVGGMLGIFPREVVSRKLARPQTVYESLVEVHHNGNVIGRASAICSSSEMRWNGRDEYAIKSMATTRATGKAFRLAFSFLAVLAGLEPTPAEEMGHETYVAQPRSVGPKPKGRAKPKVKAKKKGTR